MTPTSSRSNRLILLIHTMTITESDFVVQAQFYHTINDDFVVDNARLVGRRLSLRIHPRLRGNRVKASLQRLYAPDLRTLMKRNTANIKHHLRTVHISPQSHNIQNALIQKAENAPIVKKPALSPKLAIANGIPEKKVSIIQNTTNDHLTSDASPQQTIEWLTTHRFGKYFEIFSSFSGADMLRMSRDDFIQICGHADGIRLYNALHSKSIAPRLKIYVCRENSTVFNAIFLSSHSQLELLQKLSSVIGVSENQVRDIYMEGPQSIHIQLNNDVISHIKEETMFCLEVMQESEQYIFLLKRKVK